MKNPRSRQLTLSQFNELTTANQVPASFSVAVSPKLSLAESRQGFNLRKCSQSTVAGVSTVVKMVTRTRNTTELSMKSRRPRSRGRGPKLEVRAHALVGRNNEGLRYRFNTTKDENRAVRK